MNNRRSATDNDARADLVLCRLFPVEGVDGGRLERGGVGASVPG
jgi:hypothetical protein